MLWTSRTQEDEMGLLDSVVGMLGQGQGGANSQQTMLLQVVTTLMNNNAGGGGLTGLLQQLQQGGLGEAVSSWVSSGANMPVSADQLQSALGGHPGLAAAAQQAGIPQGDLMGQLAQFLPQVIDQLTPGGQLPANADAGAMPDLGSLLGGFLGR
jgi:uncharacterized protein YidB (DUF937 family)